MIWGILIGLFIAFVIWVFGSGAAEAGRMALINGKRYRLVAGIPNRCRHILALHQKINGYQFEGCGRCDNVYISFDEWAKVQYDR